MARKKDDLVVLSTLGDTVNWEKPNQQVEGIFQSVEKDVGKFGSNLYSFSSENGNEFKVWGSANLDPILLLAKKGDRIRITFLGIQKIQGGNRVKKFRLEGPSSLMSRVESAGVFTKKNKRNKKSVKK